MSRILSLRGGKLWMVVVAAICLVLILFLVLGNPLAGSTFARVRWLLAGMLFVPVAAILSSGVHMLIESQVRRRVSDLVRGDGGSAKTDKTAQAEKSAAIGDEIATISANLREALATLQKRRFGTGGRRWLYQLPWYAVIGPPGSGKTTAILNSGLRFPLAHRHGARPLRGVNGTRNCDWWFTDQAVLIDTAGRYSVQEDPEGTERSAWLGFLRLLRKHRRAEPINGILVVIGLDELANSAAERRRHAIRIRERARELCQELGARIPLYLIVSKLDLVDGFVDFFGALDPQGREAVWGITLDLPAPGESGRLSDPSQSIGIEFDRLVDRMDAQLVDRLNKEGDARNRGRMFGFPQRIACLRDILTEFTAEAFGHDSYDQQLLLRGVYLASGTQSPAKVAVDPSQRSSSYFLGRLFRNVVFPESGLVSADPARSRRRRLGLTFGHAAIALLTVVLGTAILAGYLRNSALASELSHSFADIADTAAALSPEQVEEPALADVLPLLDRLQAARASALEPRWGRPVFDRDHRLAASAEDAYATGLTGLLLPRMVMIAERTMQRDTGDAAALYLDLKVYLMLGGRGPLQPQVVAEWFQHELQAAFPGAEGQARREALHQHALALMSGPFQPFELDPALIEAARIALPERSAAMRVLQTILSAPEADALQPWRLIDEAGPEAGAVFADRRGDIAATRVAGIYTSAGFHKAFLPQLSRVATAEARDLWVLEDVPDAGPDETARIAGQLAVDATELYLRDASLVWDETLASITLRPMPTLGDGLRVMSALSASTSPMRLLLASIEGQTAFDRSATPADGEADPFAGDAHLLEARERAEAFAADHFRPIRALIEVPGNSQQHAVPPIDQVIADLQLLYRQLRDVSTGDLGGPLDDAGEAASVLRQVTVSAERLPQPVRGWISEISTTTVSQSAQSARDSLNRRWQEGPAAQCRRVTQNRYPFVRGATREADLAQFGALFGPDGVLDRFTRDNLNNIVDRSGSTWRWHETEGLGGLNPDALAALERADRIRTAMFAGNGQRPSVGLQITLTELAPARGFLRVRMNGQNAELSTSGTASARMHWPGAGGGGQASFSVPQRMSSRELGLTAQGDWGIYRLLDRTGIRGNARNGAVQVHFAIEDRQVGLSIQSDGSVNPLDRSLLSGFRCPTAF